MRYLNLYAGYGGNRKLLPDWVRVTAVENNPEIAAVYSSLYPDDTVIVTDAKDFLLANHKGYDFIWASPPCQKNTRLSVTGRHYRPQYPDLSVYELVIFLSQFFKGYWVVENVEPYYKCLIRPQVIGRHFFWANFIIPGFNPPVGPRSVDRMTYKQLKEYLGIDIQSGPLTNKHGHSEQYLRNAVHPEIGRVIFASRDRYQTKLILEGGVFQWERPPQL